MHRFSRTGFGTFLMLLLVCAGARAQTTVRTVALEPFEYPEGPIAGRDGGSGFASPWTGAGAVTSPTLEWPEPGGFAGTGNKLTTAGGNAGAFRTLSGRYGDDGTRVIVSFMVRGRPAGEQPDYGGISLLDGSDERLFIGKPFGSPHYGFERTGQAAVFPAQSPVPVTADTASFTCEIVFGAGTTPGNEQVFMWLNPPLRAAEAAGTQPRPPWVAAHLDVADFRFDTLRVQSGTGQESMDFDEIRIRLVVPEPATAAPMALLGGLFALRRRH